MTLPHGFQVQLAGDVLTSDRGRLLVGGSPLTAMRLTEPARTMLVGDRVTVTDAGTAQLADRLLATNIGLPDLGDVRRLAPHDLTVVIPVLDRPQALDRTLAALSPLRCVVVDDASIDATSVAGVASRHHAELVRLPINVGPAGARNAGLRTVATPYVAFVDSDVEVTAADLTLLGRHFEDPAVSLVGPRMRSVSRSEHPRWFERYDVMSSSLDLGTTAGTVRPGAAVAWLPSACLVARTEALATGFDARLRVGEDVDLVWRLVDAGHRVRYDPTVEALHDTRPTMSGWLGRKFVYGTGGARLAARHDGKLAPAVMSPPYAVAAAAVMFRGRGAVVVPTVALAWGARSIRRTLPESSDRDTVAGRLAVRGLGWAVRQESSLLLRHWWPAALVGVAVSRQMRRAVVTAIVVDTLVAVGEQRRSGSTIDLTTHVAGRRLDDLAYGAGLWWGAVRARSLSVLAPRRPGGPQARGTAPRH
jgi:mycofactocin system glycosyltransferase